MAPGLVASVGNFKSSIGRMAVPRAMTIPLARRQILNRPVLWVVLTLAAFPTVADLQSEIADQCRARAGKYGSAALSACIVEDRAAADALANYPETAETIILRCRTQFKYLGWVRIKLCADQGLEAKAALSTYPDRYQAIIKGCQIKMGAFGWHMVKMCADRLIGTDRALDNDQ